MFDKKILKLSTLVISEKILLVTRLKPDKNIFSHRLTRDPWVDLLNEKQSVDVTYARKSVRSYKVNQNNICTYVYIWIWRGKSVTFMGIPTAEKKSNMQELWQRGKQGHRGPHNKTEAMFWKKVIGWRKDKQKGKQICAKLKITSYRRYKNQWH